MKILKTWLRNAKLKSFVRYWIPQGIRDLLNRWTGHAIVYRGVFPDWESASATVGGYAEDSLFERIEDAARKVKRREAAWEQDGVLYERVIPDFPTLACLSRVALTRSGHLSVLDYGGALGSSYHQTRSFLPELNTLSWHVVEQAHVVESGRREYQTAELRYYLSLEECLASSKPSVALLSSVLQYLDEPYALLKQISESPIEYLIIDRNPCSDTEELITVQIVPPSLYPASYPSWLFDCRKLEAALAQSYERLMSWDGKDPPIRGTGIGARFGGSFWRKRKPA